MKTRGLAAMLLLGGAIAAASPAPAATPLPLTPPPPDLAPLVPFAEAPIDKPPISVTLPPLPPAPDDLPALPPAAVVLPSAEKPVAFIPAPRALPCVGRWTGLASEALECGRARFQKGEYDEATRALEQAIRNSPDRDFLREARYWLAESYYRLGRTEQADWLFRQVAQDAPKGEWGVWSLHSSGWTALRLGDAARARDAFAQLAGGSVPVPLESWVRHGLGLANYGLGRWPEARQAWEPLTARAPADLLRDVRFWYGETLGRLGEHAKAEAELSRFVSGGAHPLLAAGQLRRGWWALAAGNYAQSVSAFRERLALSSASSGPTRAGQPSETDWAEAGLALASLGAGNVDGARTGVKALQGRRSALATPVMLRLARAALEQGRAPEARTLVAEALQGTLTPASRAWALLVDGEAARVAGNRDDARTQLELAQRGVPAGPIGWRAALGLAQTNIELREFAQAVKDLQPVVAAPAPPELRAAAMVLQADAAYQAGDRAAAGAGFRRALTEFPRHAQAPLLHLGIAWSALRQDKADDARREFLAFASNNPQHPNAPDALVLASELTMAANDWDAARALLDRIVNTYPNHPRTEFARLNRAILMVRTGQFQPAVPALRDWLGRATFPPLVGRAQAALGVALLGANAPAEAAREFTLAQREGVGALADLGIGTIALGQRRWDEAAQSFGQARDTGTPAVTSAAQYGLAVLAFQRGAPGDFLKTARAVLASPAGPGPEAARRRAALLYVVTGVAADEKDWAGALDGAKQLVTEFPAHEAADDGLERVGSAAAAARQWPVVYEAYTLLAQRYPQSPFVPDSRLALGEAQAALGRSEEARRTLEQFVRDSPNDPRSAGAWVTLGRLREASGDRAGALEAYNRAPKDGGGATWTTEALRGHAKLLTDEKRWSQARPVLERLLKESDGDAAVEAATALGDAYRGDGDQLAAAEYYMTAAYLAPQSPSGRIAMLAAARSFASLRQPEAAVTVYRKLLAQPDLPADVAATARQELAALGR
jgi:TolA-binding protein